MKTIFATLALTASVLYFAYSKPANATVEVSPITGGTITPLTDDTEIVWAANQGYAYSVTIAGDRAFQNPTDLTTGADYTLVVTQDSTGTRVPTWGSAFKFPSGIKPTLSTLAGAADILKFFSNGSSVLLTSITNDVTASLLAPSALTTTLQLTDRVRLVWEDNSSNETGFEVQRDDGLGFDTITTTAASVETYDDMLGSGTYTYRIKAKRGTALSAASASVVGAVPVEDLDAPTLLVGSSVVAGGFHAVWEDNSSDEDGFKVYQFENGQIGELVLTAAANAEAGDPADPLGTGRTIHYVVVAYRGTDFSPPSNTITVVYP